MAPYATGADLQSGETRITLSHRFDPAFGSNPEGPPRKRILTLDGGGVRGAITLGFLAAIEKVLAEEWSRKGHAKADFRLSHYFDFIVGTSTGAIIASLLAAGLCVQDIRNLYRAFATTVFPKKPLQTKFGKRIKQLLTRRGTNDSEELLKLIEDEFGKIYRWNGKNLSLEAAPLKTGLGIVVRCLDTNHTWVIHNNSNAKFYDKNKNTPLSTWVLASTAAPPYFAPQTITIDNRNRVFADGGVSAFANPSLAALIISTLQTQAKKKDGSPLTNISGNPIYRGFRWSLGEDSLFIVSVGTGWHKTTHLTSRLTSGLAPLLHRIEEPLLTAFMGDANFLAQGMLLWMSEVLTKPHSVHGAAEDFSGEQLCTNKQLTYVRYDVGLHDSGCYPDEMIPPVWKTSQYMKDSYVEIHCHEYAALDNGSKVEDLLKIGDHCAARNDIGVARRHFPNKFIPSFW